MQFVVFYPQEWFDDFLKWEPELYGGIKTIVVNPTKMWTPQLAIGNRCVLIYAWISFHTRTISKLLIKMSLGLNLEKLG